MIKALGLYSLKAILNLIAFRFQHKSFLVNYFLGSLG